MRCSVCGREFDPDFLGVTITIQSWDVGPLGIATVEHERGTLRACHLTRSGACGQRLWDELAALERRLKKGLPPDGAEVPGTK